MGVGGGGGGYVVLTCSCDLGGRLNVVKLVPLCSFNNPGEFVIYLFIYLFFCGLDL